MILAYNVILEVLFTLLMSIQGYDCRFLHMMSNFKHIFSRVRVRLCIHNSSRFFLKYIRNIIIFVKYDEL